MNMILTTQDHFQNVNLAVTVMSENRLRYKLEEEEEGEVDEFEDLKELQKRLKEEMIKRDRTERIINHDGPIKR